MGFSVGSYAKIKEVEDKGNYSKAKITISKKIPNTDKYVCTFAGWVTVVGNAHKNRPMANQRIKITNCDVSNGYADRNTNEQKFTNTPQFTLYDYELQDGGQSNGYMPSGYSGKPSNGFDEIPMDSSLPFDFGLGFPAKSH